MVLRLKTRESRSLPGLPKGEECIEIPSLHASTHRPREFPGAGAFSFLRTSRNSPGVMALTARTGAACETLPRERGTSPLIERRRSMTRDSQIKMLTTEQIELVSGGTSLSPEQLARGRA